MKISKNSKISVLQVLVRRFAPGIEQGEGGAFGTGGGCMASYSVIGWNNGHRSNTCTETMVDNSGPITEHDYADTEWRIATHGR